MKERSFGIVPIYKTKDGSYRFLLIKRREGDWGFPKGHKKEGESAVTAAKREACEEAGLKTLTVQGKPAFLEKYTFQREKKTILKTVKYFIGFAKSKKTKIQKEEIGDSRWVSYKDALKLMSFKEAKEILRKAYYYLAGKR